MSALQAPLAPLQIAELDEDTLRELAADIEALGEELEIIVKRGSSYAERHGDVSLAGAVELLTHGLADGLQLRYRYRGADWWDTLLRTPVGVRLVRIQHDASGAQRVSASD